jgi:5-methylcytosine-specific restriction enzyme subunit McrC
VNDIELTEHTTINLPKNDLLEIEGELIWREYSSQVDVQFPSPRTNHEWQLTSGSWVGYIPINERIGLSLKPKVNLTNVFNMLEYAYRLKSFKFLKGLVSCDSISAYYQQLARVLARRVIDRGRKGYYYAYIEDADRNPYVRGRIDVNYLAQSPWKADLWCQYQIHTPDVVENQILNWTLRCITRSGICTEEVLPEIRRAYRVLQSLVQLTPFSATDCINRFYNRLNDDYEPLHALCQFFLEHSGPTLSAGSHNVLPFLVNMDRLYELFVFEWLAAHLPDRYYLKPQENVKLGIQEKFSFNIDIVLYDKGSDKPRCIVDTKYKVPQKPSNEDIYEVVTYAELKQCQEAILIYPHNLPYPIDEMIGGVRIRSLVFDLRGELEEAGNHFLNGLIGAMGLSPI